MALWPVASPLLVLVGLPPARSIEVDGAACGRMGAMRTAAAGSKPLGCRRGWAARSSSRGVLLQLLLGAAAAVVADVASARLQAHGPPEAAAVGRAGHANTQQRLRLAAALLRRVPAALLLGGQGGIAMLLLLLLPFVTVFV